jgi:Zn finger protein HypA/HybF involved in hydrogenase expression
MEVIKTPDPGGEQIILDPLETVFYCWACQHEMQSKDKVHFECPICHNHHTKKMAY